MADITNNLPVIQNVKLQIQHGEILKKEKKSTIKSFQQQLEDLDIQEDKIRLNIATTELEIEAIEKKLAELRLGKQ